MKLVHILSVLFLIGFRAPAMQEELFMCKVPTAGAQQRETDQKKLTAHKELAVAYIKNDIQGIEAAVKAGIDLNACLLLSPLNDSPLPFLFNVIRNRKPLDVIPALIKNGADPNKGYEKEGLWASESGMQHGPLWYAIDNLDRRIQFLGVEDQDEAYRKYDQYMLDVISLLLVHKVNPFRKTPMMAFAALERACAMSNLPLTELLLRHEAIKSKINSVGFGGLPLHASLLPNSQNRAGKKIINLIIIKLLLAEGANPYQKDSMGLDAIQILKSDLLFLQCNRESDQDLPSIRQEILCLFEKGLTEKDHEEVARYRMKANKMNPSKHGNIFSQVQRREIGMKGTPMRGNFKNEGITAF